MSRTDSTIHVGDGFAEGIAQIRNEVRNQRDYIATINNSMNSIQSIWDSPTQRKFSERFAADSRDMDEFINLLTQYLNEIERLANSYVNEDNSLRASIASAQL